MRLALALVLALAARIPSAHAQDAGVKDKDPNKDLPLEGDKQHQEGDYEGVKPGVPQTSEHGHPLKRPKNGTLSWVGFSADSGTAHLFLQAPSSFQYTQKVAGRDIVVEISGIKRLGRQVRRPLDTQYFDSPVARVFVKRGHHGKYEVHITLKKDAVAAPASAHTAVEADQYFYLYLDVAGAQSGS